MRRFVGYLGAVVIIAVFVATFVAYFVYQTDPQTKVMHDGFGRPLRQSPWLMRWVFGQERLWAGWFWFIVDMIIFWGGFFLGIGLAGWGFKDALEGEARGTS